MQFEVKRKIPVPNQHGSPKPPPTKIPVLSIGAYMKGDGLGFKLYGFPKYWPRIIQVVLPGEVLRGDYAVWIVKIQVRYCPQQQLDNRYII